MGFRAIPCKHRRLPETAEGQEATIHDSSYNRQPFLKISYILLTRNSEPSIEHVQVCFLFFKSSILCVLFIKKNPFVNMSEFA